MDTVQLHKAQTALSFMYGRGGRGKKTFVKFVNSLQSGNKMKEGFASYLTFFILQKINLVTKQEMVAKKEFWN